MTSAQVPAAKDRIALPLSDLNGGGVQKMTLALATRLQARGHEVDLVLYRAAGDLLPRIPPGIAVHELSPKAFLQGRLGPSRPTRWASGTC